MPFRFNMLLQQAGIDPGSVRLLRHQPTVARRSLLDVWRVDRAAFEDWQQGQTIANRPRLKGGFWAAFIGTWDGRTAFAGLYRVGEPSTIEVDVPVPLTGVVDKAGEIDRYSTERVDEFERYAGKLYVDWGGGASGKRAWVQRADLQDKLITELRLETVEQPFPGLMNIAAPLSTLADVPSHWVQQLQRSRGIYLLTCPRDGSLYVGSTTAEGGFWARWNEYRANGHGGNIALIDRDPSDFIVSVLEVAGSAATTDDILAAETLWKRKLASRELGLNRN